MNPYHVLGVSTNATDQEIKRAYRNLVKRYHPDRRSPEASHEAIAAINQAYDILSDPEKRAQYDRGFASIFVEYQQTQQQEDPVEAYKREFKRKRWEREKKEHQDRIAWRKKMYRVMRWLHIPVLIFMVLLIARDWAQDKSIPFFHLVMLFNAGFLCYQKNLSDFAYRLSFFTFFLFLMMLLYYFG